MHARVALAWFFIKTGNRSGIISQYQYRRHSSTLLEPSGSPGAIEALATAAAAAAAAAAAS